MVRQHSYGYGFHTICRLRGETYITGIADLAKTLTSIGERSQKPPEDQPKPPDFEPRNPYKGLHPFRSEDRQDFFGRNRFVNELISALQFDTKLARFLAVVGASGSGKSSVIMAGLLPALQEGAISGSEHWHYVAPFVPGKHPIENMTIALANVFPQKSQKAIREDLDNPNTRGLHMLARQAAGHDYLVIYIDQFEELFTLTAGEEERRQFIDLLTTAASESDGAAIVILSMRADFYDRPLEYNELGDLFKAHTQPVLPMTLADLYEAIETPAQLPDVQIRFDDGLVTELLFAVREETGILPLLQFTLDQLFQQREGQLLTRAAYQAMGGVRGALAKHAEQTYINLPTDEHRRMARALFLRLLEPGQTEHETTRRRAPRAELTLTDNNQTQVLQETTEVFINNRLLVSEEDTIEVIHEALIREWERLHGWLNESREDLRLHQKINTDASDWVRASRPQNYGGFYRGTLLIDAQQWLEHNVAAKDEAAFIIASVDADKSRQMRDVAIARRVQNFKRASVISGVMAVLAIIIGVVAGVTASSAREESNDAQTAQARANADVGTAQAEQMTAMSDANDAGTQVAIIVPTITAANEEIINANSTLTPIPATLTVAVEQFAEAQEDLRQAQAEANEASTQIAEFEPTIEHANTQIAGVQPTLDAANQEIRDANATLRRIPATLTIAVAQVAEAQDDAEDARGKADEANTQVARFEPTIEYASTQIAKVEPTLEAANQQITDGQSTLTALDEEMAQADALLDARQLIARAKSMFENTQNQPLALALAYEASLVDNSSQTQSILGDLAYQPGARHRFEEHTAPVFGGAVFSPDGSLAISGSCAEHAEDEFCAKGEIILWDVDTGEVVRRLQGHAGTVRSLAFSPDGSFALSGSCAERDDDNTCISGEMILWDVESGRSASRFEGHTDWVWSVAYSPDGSRVLSGSLDGTMILWDVESGEIVRQFEGHSDSIQSVAFSPDGTQMLSGSTDSTVILWNTASGRIVRRFEGHRSPVWSVAFSPDGTLALSGSEEATIWLWDLSTGQVIQPLRSNARVIRSVMFHPDGSLAVSASGDNSVILWDTESGEIVHRFLGHDDDVWSVAFDPTGQRILSSSRDSSLILWDVGTGQIARRFINDEGPATAAIISPDGTQVLTGDINSNLILRDIETGEIVRRLQGHTGAVRTIVYSLDGSQALSGSNDATLILWDMESGEIVRRLTGHTDSVTAAALSPDGLLAVSGSCAERNAAGFCIRGEIIVWDVSTGEMIHRVPHHKLFINAVAFSPDGSSVLSGANDATLILWDVESGDIIREFKGHSGPIRSAAFTEDGSYALTGSNDGKVILWDVQSGDIVQQFHGHTDWVRSVAISPNGSYALSGSNDDSVFLWDIEEGALLRRFESHTDDVHSVTFSPDGAFALSSSAGNLILWRIDDLEQLQVWIRKNRYMPELTCEERETYGLPEMRLCVDGNLPDYPSEEDTDK